MKIEPSIHEPFSACWKTRIPPILRWAGGKFYVVKTLCRYVPPHRDYVEPFAGGASLFFAKKPALKEVLSDINCTLINFYKTFRKLKSLDDLLHYGWFPKKTTFESCKSCIETGEKCEYPRAYCFLFLNKFAYGGKSGRYSTNPAKIERCRQLGKYCEISNVARNFDRIKERLKNVTLLCEDYRRVISRYDSGETFFYLDPPYYKTSGHRDFYVKEVEPRELYESVRGVKGNFLLTYNDHPLIRKLFGRFHVSKAQTRMLMSGQKGRHLMTHLLIRNY